MFWDDSFTVNRKIIEKYCNAIINSKLKIVWKTATRADLVDKQILRLIKKAGCIKLEIGVESGSDRMKKLIHKDVTNEQIKRAFAMINKNGISSGAFFMAGFPEETLQDISQTFQFMKELNATEIFFNILDPMPGSKEYEKCIEFGLVPKNPDWNNFPLWPDAHYVKDISRDKFKEYVNMMAKMLYSKNNSFKNRFRRNKYLVISLLKYDPISLLKKAYRFIKRRRQYTDTNNFTNTKDY